MQRKALKKYNSKTKSRLNQNPLCHILSTTLDRTKKKTTLLKYNRFKKIGIL